LRFHAALFLLALERSRPFARNFSACRFNRSAAQNSLIAFALFTMWGVQSGTGNLSTALLGDDV
jgi:hypothetical protein